MTTFRFLLDALHAGYEVIAPTPEGYLVRLSRADCSESYGLVVLARSRVSNQD